MLDFTYSCPTNIVFGNNQTEAVGSLCKGYKEVLLVYGSGSVIRNGILEKVTNSLEKENVHYLAFGGVKANPDLDKVEEGRRIAVENKVDLVLGVGGGSVIDTAKAIAVSIACTDAYSMFQRVCQNYEDVKTDIKVGVVLTIASSGSETGESFVITHENKKLIGTVASCAPLFAILDPVNTLSLPPYQTACSAADILSHLQERYFVSSFSNDLSDHWLEQAMIRVIQTSVLLMDHPSDLELRAGLMWTATLAHNGILDRGRGAGDWACHMIEHELSAIYPITHGEGLSMITLSWLRYCSGQEEARKRLELFSKNVWNASFDNEQYNIEYAVSQQESWYRKLGLKTGLGQWPGIAQEDLIRISRSFGWELGDMVKLNSSAIEAILLHSLRSKG